MTPTDAALAASIAEEAGRLLLEVRDSGMEGKELGREGDLRSNELILRRLAEARPDDAVLSEESADSPTRLRAARVWIVDPLDGTREFSVAGRADWAVHVALWEAGRGISAAAVSQPALGEVFGTERPAPLAPSRADGARILVSDSRPPAFAGPVAEALGASLAPMGSAGAKALAVLKGQADAYLHAGGQWEWDSAAPVGVVTASGCHASRLDGTPIRYNQAHPYVPDLVICRPEMAERLLGVLSRLATG